MKKKYIVTAQIENVKVCFYKEKKDYGMTTERKGAKKFRDINLAGAFINSLHKNLSKEYKYTLETY